MSCVKREIEELLRCSRHHVIITCKDEIDHIPYCLESVRHVADEILVADSGSRDGTWEYLQAQNDCRLVQREYVNAGNFRTG